MIRVSFWAGVMSLREGLNQVLHQLKVVESNLNGSALQQLKDMGYADKYRSRDEPVHLIGVEFSKVSRNIVGFGVETLMP